MDVKNTINNYISKGDWRVKENANTAFSFSGLMAHIGEKEISKYMLSEVYNKQISDAHKNAYFHIHDLGHGLVGYCAGWSLKQLLETGFNGIKDKVSSASPKHFRTALGQMVNFLGTMQMEFAGAQAFSSFDTYLAPYVAKDKLTFAEVKQGLQEFIFNMNVPSRWGCVTPDTEILTKDGWKTYKDLKINENIYGFDIKTGEIKNDKILRINEYDFNGDLIVLKNRNQEQLLSPNHKVIREVFNSNDSYNMVKDTAENIYKYKTPINIPVAGFTHTKHYDINDSILELYAWVLSDGSIYDKEHRISIYQSPTKNKQYCKEIERILNINGISYNKMFNKTGLGSGTNRYRINRKNSREIMKVIEKQKLPMNLLRKCSERQIKLFIDTYRKGDGEKSRFRITTVDEEICDNFQELAVLCGYGTSVIVRNKGGISKKPQYIISFLTKGNGFVTITKKKKINYEGKIWCPTTKTNNWIARRNGTVFITGNSQAPFTNITLDWSVPEDMADKHPKINDKELDETYSDFQDEMDIINKAFLEIMIGGDSDGRIFSFPIPTYNITEDFVWDNDNAKLLFEMTAKYGIPYFQNFINSTIKPGDVRSMCCRLQLDIRELRMRGNGLFGAGEQTGSIGVVTINLAKLAYEASHQQGEKQQDKKVMFFALIEKFMLLAKDSLEIKRKLINENLEKNLMPYTKRYLGTWDNHFSTIGLIGMNEAALNLLGEDITGKEGYVLAQETLDFMREQLSNYQEETGNFYNLEATPGEGTTYRLAKIDAKQYPDIIQQGCLEDKTNYYTNSSQLPVGYTEDVIKAIKHQDNLQTKYTGGTVLHVFLGERVTDWINTMMLVKKIAYSTKMPYFTITPTFSICPVHGYISGEHEFCPLDHSEENIKKYGIMEEQ